MMSDVSYHGRAVAADCFTRDCDRRAGGEAALALPSVAGRAAVGAPDDDMQEKQRRCCGGGGVVGMAARVLTLFFPGVYTGGASGAPPRVSGTLAAYIVGILHNNTCFLRRNARTAMSMEVSTSRRPAAAKPSPSPSPSPGNDSKARRAARASA